jgi:predicted esterase
MAFRAACAGVGATAVVALGGDVPPELAPESLRRIRHVLLARGDSDPWYTHRQFAADQVRLREAGVDLTSYAFEGDHAWTPAFSEAVGHYLHRLGSPGH